MQTAGARCAARQALRLRRHLRARRGHAVGHAARRLAAARRTAGTRLRLVRRRRVARAGQGRAARKTRSQQPTGGTRRVAVAGLRAWSPGARTAIFDVARQDLLLELDGARQTRRSRARRRRRPASPGARRGPIASRCSAATPTSTRACPARRRPTARPTRSPARPLGFRERSHVMSLAGDGRLFWRISLGEKVAAKRREELSPDGIRRVDDPVDQPRHRSTSRARWDALVEYRLLVRSRARRSRTASPSRSTASSSATCASASAGTSPTSPTTNPALGDGSEKGFFIRAAGFLLMTRRAAEWLSRRGRPSRFRGTGGYAVAPTLACSLRRCARQASD